MADDLRQPLRRRRLRDHLRFLKPSPLRAATLVAIAGGLTLILWVANAPRHLVGEPVVHVLIEVADPIATGTTDALKERQAENEADGSEATAPSPDDLAADQEMAEGEPETQAKDTPLAPPMRSLSENGRFGLLPKISSNGRKPWLVYAKPVPRSQLQAEAAKIAIVLGGMGLNEDLTRRAIADLPSGVTFAFAPYGKSVQALVNAARGEGHEVMLHLPMEPFGYPTVDPGPRTLLASAEPARTLQNLHWLMSRFSGYTGVLNYMGARFTGERDAFETVAAELGRRGLVYLDDGSSIRSLAEELGGTARLPVRKADRLIDVSGGFGITLNNLRAAEAEARGAGVVVVVGSGLASTIEAVQAWAKGADERGVLIVPASAAFRCQESGARCQG